MKKSVFSKLKLKERERLVYFLLRGMYPESIRTIPALEGFLYGIAITPDIAINEWLISEILADRMIEDEKEIDFIIEILFDAYVKLREKFLLKRLKFPFKIIPHKLTSKFERELQQWAYGFYSALHLRPDVWKLEYMDENSPEPPEELFPYLMNLQVICDLALADEIPELYKEFMENPEEDKYVVLAFVYSKIEEAVNSLIAYAQSLHESYFEQDFEEIE